MVGVVGVGVLVDVHVVHHLMTGVGPQGPVARLAGDGAGAEAGGVVTVVLLRGPRQGGAAGPPGHEAGSVVAGGAQASHGGRSPGTYTATVQEVRSHARLITTQQSA